MTENEKENECCHCGDTACEIIFTADYGEEMVCQDCEGSEYFTCPEYGTIHHKEDGYDVEGELYSEDGYNDITVYCEWSGDTIHRESAISVNGDYYIREDLEYDLSSCCECGHEGHCDDFNYSERHDGYYCEDCHPPDGNEWYNSFRKISSDFDRKPKRNEVKGWVGIEFEIENAYDGPTEDEMPEFAIAETDGSLNNGGLEYKTHVQKGADVKNVIDKFCEMIPEYGMSADDSTIGWHFHYSLEEREDGHIRNMGKAWADFSDMVKGSNGFNYFRNMVRGYAQTLPSDFTKVLRDYDGKESLFKFSQGKAYPPRGCMVNLCRLMQRGSAKGNDQRRVEIRMYTPRTFLQNFDIFHPNEMGKGVRHELLGQDFHNFILFWDEFMRKSAVKRLTTKNNTGDLMNLRQFSMQFSPTIRNWLRSRENAKVIPHPMMRDLIEEIDDLEYLRGYDEHYGSTNSRYR